MGTLYPRISALVLAKSALGQEGFNTAAKSIADSVAGSVSLALTGLIFAALGDAATRTPYVGVLVFTSAISLSRASRSAAAPRACFDQPPSDTATFSRGPCDCLHAALHAGLDDCVPVGLVAVLARASPCTSARPSR